MRLASPAVIYKGGYEQKARFCSSQSMPREGTPTGARSLAKAMAKDDPASHRANRLLAALSSQDFERVARHMETVLLPHRQVLAEPGEELEHAYFPHSGAICLVAVMAESGAAETAAIGPEGVAGLEAIFGSHAVSS